MTNHVHLLITPAKEQGVSLLMQDVGRKYVHYVNRSYGRSGTLWEGRFKASLVDADAYLLMCHRYIESNPVRAGIAKSLSDYRWSSYHYNAYGKIDPLVRPHSLYLDLADDGPARRRIYRDIFSAAVKPSVMNELREATNRELVFGGDDFKDRVEREIGRQVRPASLGRPKVQQGK